ncbi:MAG TPA: dicarboxylate/amino acid:cation symporter, partial [bacterium]|nr:dicarboxylate/amino acid:cation symporter [bacterium]
MSLKTILKKMNLGTWILIAMFAGIAGGIIFKENAEMFRPVGELFIKLIKMLVVPLVAFSIILGASSLGDAKNAGKAGITTFVYYLMTTAFAVVLGLLAGTLFEPGKGLELAQFQGMFSEEYAQRGVTPGFWETVLGFVPENPFGSLGEGNILQILFFALFFGFGLSKVSPEKKAPVINIISTVNDVLIWMILKVMWTAPIGVFALMADAVGTFGWDILALIMKLLFIYIVVLIIQTFGVYPSLVKIFSKKSPLEFLKKISKAQIVALSTSSSMATLPVTMEVCERELNVSKETTSFVLPLGATINMDGNAIYYALAALFFAQLFGIELGMAQYVAIILTATLGSIGQAGVPGPTLLVVAVLIAADIPIIGLPLLFGVDRIFDMLRTAVNITGDASCAII